MPCPDTGADLAVQQAALVRALTGGGASPDGFDGERLTVARQSLADKRRRAAARAWPVLARALGEAFAGRFAAYAERTPIPRRGGPLADGRLFARDLAATGELPEDARLEALRVDLHHARRGNDLVRRRGPALVVTLLPQRRLLVAALRIPLLGEYWLRLPLGRPCRRARG